MVEDGVTEEDGSSGVTEELRCGGVDGGVTEEVGCGGVGEEEVEVWYWGLRERGRGVRASPGGS